MNARDFLYMIDHQIISCKYIIICELGLIRIACDLLDTTLRSGGNNPVTVSILWLKLPCNSLVTTYSHNLVTIV